MGATWCPRGSLCRLALLRLLRTVTSLLTFPLVEEEQREDLGVSSSQEKSSELLLGTRSHSNPALPCAHNPVLSGEGQTRAQLLLRAGGLKCSAWAPGVPNAVCQFSYTS